MGDTSTPKTPRCCWKGVKRATGQRHLWTRRLSVRSATVSNWPTDSIPRPVVIPSGSPAKQPSWFWNPFGTSLQKNKARGCRLAWLTHYKARVTKMVAEHEVRAKDRPGESSLVALWLGLWVFTAMDQVQSLIRELRCGKTCGTAKKKGREREPRNTHVCLRNGLSTTASKPPNREKVFLFHKWGTNQTMTGNKEAIPATYRNHSRQATDRNVTSSYQTPKNNREKHTLCSLGVKQ